MKLVNKMLAHIKTNKVMYLRLLWITAMLLNIDCVIFANDFGNSLDKVGNLIVDMLLSVAKWGSISIGIKNMITTVLQGGNIRQAMNEGIQYLIGFLFIQFYPQLFDLFKGIKF